MCYTVEHFVTHRNIYGNLRMRFQIGIQHNIYNIQYICIICIICNTYIYIYIYRIFTIKYIICNIYFLPPLWCKWGHIIFRPKMAYLAWIRIFQKNHYYNFPVPLDLFNCAKKSLVWIGFTVLTHHFWVKHGLLPPKKNYKITVILSWSTPWPLLLCKIY